MVRQFHEDLSNVHFLDLDMTTTCWDSKAKCNEVGLRFSDADTPFPTTVRWAIAGGTWTHSAGNGWQPGSGTNDQGPAILFPIIYSPSFQIETIWDVSAANAAHFIRINVGMLSSTNHVASEAATLDTSGAAVRYSARLNTNDGDDTFTNRYTGANMDGAAEWLLHYRTSSSTCSVYDDQNNSWNDYSGRQAAGISYTPAYGYIQVTKYSEGTLATVYLANLKLIYLV